MVNTKVLLPEEATIVSTFAHTQVWTRIDGGRKRLVPIFDNNGKSCGRTGRSNDDQRHG